MSSGDIRFAEKILTLLNEGQFASTYKYAVLLALLDLSLENVSRTGEPPEMFTTEQLAVKVIELYWPHAVPFQSGGSANVLRQNGGNRQAGIVSAIQKFRENLAAKYAGASMVQLRQRAEGEFKQLRDQVEWHLIEMPLPRVQKVGSSRDAFIYEWDEGIRRAEVRKYQKGKPSDFDNRIQLRPGVGRHLIDLNGLLRPFIHRQWSAMVARLNGMEEAHLECFLFGADRTPLTAVVPALRELQAERCFYCQARLPREVHVDHFIPWSRYPENGLANLVLAHTACNLQKRDFLPATPHVMRWSERLASTSLSEIETRLKWDAAVDEMRGVARGIYLRLPDDALLWTSGKSFARPDSAQLRSALG